MELRRRIRVGFNRWRALPSYQKGLVFVLLATVVLYEYVVSQFPTYINDQVIYSIATVLLNVEGFLFALTPQIHKRGRKLVVAVGLVAVLFSVITISKAYFESIQLKYLSYLPTTSIFDSDVVMFGLFLGLYAVSVLTLNPTSMEK